MSRPTSEIVSYERRPLMVYVYDRLITGPDDESQLQSPRERPIAKCTVQCRLNICRYVSKRTITDETGSCVDRLGDDGHVGSIPLSIFVPSFSFEKINL